MTVRLRAHHLLCMLTYVGNGYSPAFVENYEVIAARLSAGEEIELVAGPDDICVPLTADPDAHCHGASVIERDRAAASGDTGRVHPRRHRAGAVHPARRPRPGDHLPGRLLKASHPA